MILPEACEQRERSSTPTPSSTRYQLSENYIGVIVSAKNEPSAEGRGASSLSSTIERGRSERSQLGRYEIHNPISSRTRPRS
jgi:hypothetical protein